MPSNIPDDGLVPAVDPTRGPGSEGGVSQRGAEGQRRRRLDRDQREAELDYEAAAQRAPGEF